MPAKYSSLLQTSFKAMLRYRSRSATASRSPLHEHPGVLTGVVHVGRPGCVSRSTRAVLSKIMRYLPPFRRLISSMMICATPAPAHAVNAMSRAREAIAKYAAI